MSRKLQKDEENSVRAKDAKTNTKMKTAKGISDLKSKSDDGRKILVRQCSDTVRLLLICVHKGGHH